jgi:hypothetical protein
VTKIYLDLLAGRTVFAAIPGSFIFGGINCVRKSADMGNIMKGLGVL